MNVWSYAGGGPDRQMTPARTVPRGYHLSVLLVIARPFPSKLPSNMPGMSVPFSGSPSARATVARTLLRSEEQTSELQSLMRISYAVFCLKKKKITVQQNTIQN